MSIRELLFFRYSLAQREERLCICELGRSIIRIDLSGALSTTPEREGVVEDDIAIAAA